MIHCQSCGEQQKENTKFCSNCGKPLSGVGKAKKHRVKRMVLIAIGIFVLFFSAILLVSQSAETPGTGTSNLNVNLNSYSKYSDLLNQVSSASKEGRLLREQEKYAESMAAYQKAIALEAPLSLAYQESFKVDAEKTTVVPGIMADLYAGLSFTYRDFETSPNNLQSAISAAEKAVEKNPDSQKEIEAAYLSQLADLQRLYGAYDLSLTNHRKAIELDPKNAHLYAWYGVAQAAKGDVAGAKSSWRKALELDPNNADAAKFLETF